MAGGRGDNSREYTYSRRAVGSCTLRSHEMHAEAAHRPPGRARDVEPSQSQTIEAYCKYAVNGEVTFTNSS